MRLVFFTLPGLIVRFNWRFPIGTHRSSASHACNRAADHFIVQPCPHAVGVVIDRAVFTNTKMLCRLDGVNIGAEEQKENAGVQKLVKDLNVLYRENKALYECDDQAKGFQWMNEISANECYVSFVRKGEEAEELLLVVANFSGVPREITTGVPYEGKYKEILNTDAVQYGGTGVVNDRVKRAEDVEWDDKKQSVTVKMAPLSLSILQFIPYTEAELEKVIEKRIRKNTPIRKTAGKTTKRKQEK